MYVFFITTLLLAYICLAVIGLLSVARNLWGRPWPPLLHEKDLDDEEDLGDEWQPGEEWPQASQPIRAASRDIPLEREYS